MEIKKLVLGELRTNCYIVIKNDKCLIIDPADDAETIKDICKDYKVKGILVTHHHFDHIGALEQLEEYYNIKHNNHNNSFNYEVINTPGHTSDCITFYFKEEGVMFTGDFIFYHTCGRCDLKTSSVSEMLNSLEMVKSYDDNITIYPGHGKETTLGEEKQYFYRYFG
ncbi:MAG: MBL fold metallo-hydrolase [Firmicutes bacterium]|nr:MBL fold metallo-hydrolase [Bacillota bacterium]